MIYRIITIRNCVYCDKAKSTLNALDLEFTEQVVDRSLVDVRKFGHSTFPVIFLEEDDSRTLIGGYDNLVDHIKQKEF